jgi:leucyl aminopeptidase (aminopeptidase T)
MDDENRKTMVEGAKNALKEVLSINPGDPLLIVTDKNKLDIGKAFELGGAELGANVKTYLLPEDQRPLAKVPEEIKDQLIHCTEGGVIINAFEANSEETPFRIQLIKQELGTKSRVGHAPGITQSMMSDGPMNVDYSKVAADVDNLMKLFKGAKSVHITTPGGTDITLGIEDRDFDTDIRISEGTFGNLPAGEIWCAPIENQANGVIVCDGSIGDIGQVPSPLKLEVINGELVAIESDDIDLIEKITQLTEVDEMAGIIGELGIGLNPRARLTGNLLEDEKAGKTAHIAFGNNTEMPNGKNKSKTHRDFLFYSPTFEVEYTDGTKKILIKDGEIVD